MYSNCAIYSQNYHLKGGRAHKNFFNELSGANPSENHSGLIQLSRRDEKSDFPLIFGVFSYQENNDTHKNIFFTKTHFLSKYILQKGGNYLSRESLLPLISLFGCLAKKKKKALFGYKEKTSEHLNTTK